MSELPVCPKCKASFTYVDVDKYVCPMCAHEWSMIEEVVALAKICDANGVELHDGDSVSVIKDLKLGGSSSVIKQGTKAKNIRLVYDSDHDIDCKIDGIGAMSLKSQFVKKI